jgi:SAM-dependent methyltransferase
MDAAQTTLELQQERPAAFHAAHGSASVLDMCCGSRMFWFDRKNPRAIFVDKRRETHLAADCSVKNGEREIVIDPDLVADFTNLPFEDNSFAHVIFDPPHIQRNGDTSWLLKKYGVLRGDWREMLRLGFAEGFRVLRPEGTLIFKWNEIEVPLREILALTPVQPLYGHRTGKQAKTHWCAFLKPNKSSSPMAAESHGGAQPKESNGK